MANGGVLFFAKIFGDFVGVCGQQKVAFVDTMFVEIFGSQALMKNCMDCVWKTLDVYAITVDHSGVTILERFLPIVCFFISFTTSAIVFDKTEDSTCIGH